MAIVTINQIDTLEIWRIAYNNLTTFNGDTLIPLTTVANDVVGAINEITTFNGDTTIALATTANNVVGAINEISTVIGNLGATYATVAQGALADSALQPSNIINDNAMGGVSPSIIAAPSQSSTQAYVDAAVVGLYNHKGGYDATNNNANLDGSPIPPSTTPIAIPVGTIFKGDAYTVNSPGNFFTEFVDIGDVLIANQNDPLVLSDWTRVNKNINIATTTSTGTVTLATSTDTVLDKVVQSNDTRIAQSTTTNRGTVTLASDRQVGSNIVVQGNDTRIATATNVVEGISTVGDLVGNALKLNAPIAPGTNPSLPSLDGSLLTGLLGDRMVVIRRELPLAVSDGTFTQDTIVVRKFSSIVSGGGINPFLSVANSGIGVNKDITFSKAGTYYVYISCPAYRVHTHASLLMKGPPTTNANVTPLIMGSVVRSHVSDATTSLSIISGFLTVTDADVLLPTIYNVGHICQNTRINDGLGTAGLWTNPSSTNITTNVYSQGFFIKLD